MTEVEMIRYLKQQGCKVLRVQGSHYFMEKGSLVTSIPHHHKELGKGLESRLYFSWKNPAPGVGNAEVWGRFKEQHQGTTAKVGFSANGLT